MSVNTAKQAWLDVGDELESVARDDLRETGHRLVDVMGTTFREATRAVRSVARA